MDFRDDDLSRAAHRTRRVHRMRFQRRRHVRIRTSRLGVPQLHVPTNVPVPQRLSALQSARLGVHGVPAAAIVTMVEVDLTLAVLGGCDLRGDRAVRLPAARGRTGRRGPAQGGAAGGRPRVVPARRTRDSTKRISVGHGSIRRSGPPQRCEARRSTSTRHCPTRPRTDSTSTASDVRLVRPCPGSPTSAPKSARGS